MAGIFGFDGGSSGIFNPRQVSLGRGNGSIPYLQNSPISMNGGEAQRRIGPVSDGGPQAGAPAPGSALSAEAVRAMGSGPFDATYRQNLATYAGGQFFRPGGNLSFDPTGGSLPFGQPTGGGSAPVLGMPSSLVSQALSGNPFSFTPPAPPSPPQDQFTDPLGWWKQQFTDNGDAFRSRKYLAA